MIAHVKLDWLIAQQEAESTLCVHVDRLLQVEFFEGDDVLSGLHPFVFDDSEVKLIVDDPIIVYKKNCAIFQEELRDVWPLGTEDIEWRRGYRRWNGARGIPITEGETVVHEGRRPEGAACCPPAEIGRIHGNCDRKKINAQSWW